jgi:hypothetical protein
VVSEGPQLLDSAIAVFLDAGSWRAIRRVAIKNLFGDERARFSDGGKDMKSRSIRTTLFSVVVLLSPILTYARGDIPRIYTSARYQSQKPAAVSQDLGVRAGGKIHPQTAPHSRDQVRAKAVRCLDSSAFRK